MSRAARARVRGWARFDAGAVFVLLLALLAPAAAETEEDTWYVRKITVGDAPMRVEHFWSKGLKLRAETVVAGRLLVTIVRGEDYYVLDSIMATGVAIRRSPAALEAEKKRVRPFANEGADLLKEGAEKVSTEEVLGRPCDLYRLTDRQGRREVCISQDDLKLPLHFQGFDRATGRMGQVRYVDWARGFPVPDTFFDPDPRFKIERVDYDDYLKRASKGTVGPAPVLYRQLLHGD